MDAPLRVLLIGAGGFGREWWTALRTLGHQVVGVVDPDEEALADARAALGVPADRARPCAGDWGAWGADAVIDSSPPWLHRDHALAGFQAGLDVLVAKPLALDMGSARDMVAAAEAEGRVLAVAQQKRLLPGFLALRRLVTGGELGALGVATIELNVDGRGWEPGMEWRLEMEQPLLLEGSVHHFDLMRWILGHDVAAVFAVTFNPTWSPFAGDACLTAVVEMDDGLSVLYRASWAPNGSAPVSFFSGWRLEFEGGCAELVEGEVLVDGRALGVLAGRPGPGLAELNVEILRRFAAAVRRRDDAFCGGADNLRSMAAVHAALESARSGRRVDVERVLVGERVRG